MQISLLSVDTSVYISSLIFGEKYSKESRQFFKMLQKKKITIVVPISTIFEILQAYFRITQSVEKTDRVYQALIEAAMQKELQIVNLEASFLVYFTAHHQLFDLKTADTIVALTGHRMKCPLVTWDKQLIKNAKKHLKVFTPLEFIR